MKKRKNMILAVMMMACLAMGSNVVAAEENLMALHPRAQMQYEEQQKTVYVVQAGTFAVYQNAVNFADELNNMGLYAEIEYASNGRYNVISGTYENYSDAEQKGNLLYSLGYDNWIREVTKTVLVPVKYTEYRVQVGAFDNKVNADNYVKQLMTQGFGGYSELDDDGLYKVYCGTYEEKEDAEYLKQILEWNGYEVYIREYTFYPEVLQTYFVVQAGAFKSNENAQNYAAELNRAGFNAYSTLAESGYYTVFCGTFKVKENADNLKASLNNAGYDAIVIEYQM